MKKTKKTEKVIRVSWNEGSSYKVVYFRRKDADELFDTITRLKRKRLDFNLKVNREENVQFNTED